MRPRLAYQLSINSHLTTGIMRHFKKISLFFSRCCLSINKIKQKHIKLDLKQTCLEVGLIRLFGWQKVFVRLLGVLLAVGGIALVIQIVPIQLWYIIIGAAMIFAGWMLFKYCDQFNPLKVGKTGRGKIEILYLKVARLFRQGYKRDFKSI